MALPISDYEKRRLKNIEDNKRVLAEFGLLNPYLKLNVSRGVTKKSAKRPVLEELPRKRRRSARLRGEAPSEGSESSSLSDNDETTPNFSRPTNYYYGHIDGVPVGSWWESRMECSRAGVHRPTVAGIHGNTEMGAYSVALSGGYEDNVDLGECFTYTGEGGRDLRGTTAKPKNLRTAPQTKDQTLSRGNLALCQSVETGNPVRVVRGFKLPTKFAPQTGYRYDGLYTVQKCWYATGAAGYGVWKFAFKRCENQDPLPFVITQSEDDVKIGTNLLTVNVSSGSGS